MTWRIAILAVLVGMPLGLILAAFGYRNDWLLQQTYVASDLLPFSVYGFLVLGLLVINPILALIRQRAALRGAEWGVIIALMLVACVIPGPGLMWTFSNTFVMPHHYHETNPGWRATKDRPYNLIDFAPDVMLVGPWTPPERWFQQRVDRFEAQQANAHYDALVNQYDRSLQDKIDPNQAHASAEALASVVPQAMTPWPVTAGTPDALQKQAAATVASLQEQELARQLDAYRRQIAAAPLPPAVRSAIDANVAAFRSSLLRDYTPADLATPLSFEQIGSLFSRLTTRNQEQLDAALAATPADLAKEYRDVLHQVAPQAAAAVQGAAPEELARKYRDLASNYLKQAGLYREDVVGGFQKELRTSRGSEVNNIAFSDVPWEAWVRPLSFWVPLVALCFVGGIGLVLVVHRQWSQRERLRYPLAEVVSELYQGAGEHRFANIFRNNLFWLGFVPAFLILFINGAKTWEWLNLEIPLGLDIETTVKAKYPRMGDMPNGTFAFLKPSIAFAAIGFAYFLSSEVSFSLGISHILFGVFWYTALWSQDINTAGDYFEGTLHSHHWFGSYLGMAIIVLYVGRRHYTQVFLNAFGMRTADKPDRAATWGLRLALLCALGMVLMLVFIVNLHWLLATLLVMLLGLLFLIVTRLHVETGLFFIQPSWHAVGVLLGIFGITALGPEPLIILALVSSVIALDPRVCLMPMVATGMRFCENEKVQPGRLAPFLIVMVLLAIGVGVVVTLYYQYNEVGTAHDWLNWGGKAPYNLLQANLREMKDQLNPQQFVDRLGEGFLPGFTRPDERFMTWAFWGLAMVLVTSFFRLRFQWWPLHPAMFLVWGSMPMARLAPSFLLGWMIKSAVTHFGGGDAYRKYKPLFIGIIAGALFAGIFWQIAGVSYYEMYGEAAKSYKIHW